MNVLTESVLVAIIAGIAGVLVALVQSMRSQAKSKAERDAALASLQMRLDKAKDAYQDRIDDVTLQMAQHVIYGNDIETLRCRHGEALEAKQQWRSVRTEMLEAIEKLVEGRR
jgi:ribosome recycling factor